MKRVRGAVLVGIGVLVVTLWSGLQGVLTAIVIHLLLSNVGLIDGEVSRHRG